MAELVINGDFETGDFTGWTQANTGGLGTFISVSPAFFGIQPPHGGTHSVCLICSDGGNPNVKRYLYQDINIPVGVPAQLSFWYGLTRTFSHGRAKCDICDTSDNILSTVFSQVSSTQVTSSWTNVTVALDAFAGQTIRLKFGLEITSAAVGNVFFSLDDISLTVPDSAPDTGGVDNTIWFNGRGRTTLRDPLNRFWSMQTNDDGTLAITTLDGLTLRDFENPVLKASGEDAFYRLSVASDGSLVTDKVTGEETQRAIEYFPFRSTEGTFFKLRVRLGGLLRIYETEDYLPDSFPFPRNIVYSSYGPRLVHSSCQLPAIVALGDLALWCTACNKFVLPENSNIIVVLDE